MRRASGLGAAVAAAAVLFAITPLASWLEEEVGLTWLFLMRAPREPPPDVIVVAIDREAAQVLGQPARVAEWPRTLHARLVDALSGARARVVAFDLSFATPARDPAEDRALASALARAGNVVLLDFLEQQEVGEGGLQITRRSKPIPLLASAAAAHGPFPLPKTGLVHAYWLREPGAGAAATLPTLAYDIYRRAAPAHRAIDAAEEARYLDFYGPPRSVRTIGFHEVLSAAAGGKDGAAWLRAHIEHRAVFVGYSAAQPSEQDRVRDDYRTVFSRADGLDISGVEIAATAFANLIEDRAPTPLPLATQLALLIAWALLLGVSCTALRGGYALAGTTAAALGYLALAHERFVSAAQWLPLVTPLMAEAPLALFGGVLWHYIDERRERRRLGALVDDLLPRSVVETLLSRLRRVAPAEQQVFGVFVMTDIEGFTTIAEGMSPIDSTRMLNDYFALIFPPVENHGGSVSEIDGDAMLAFWIESGTRRQACRAACTAALEIAELTRGVDVQPGSPRLTTRIGVHGGPFTLARIGASRHHEYRAVGDAANTASRIEALSKHLGTRLLVSEDVVADVEDLLTRPVGTFLLAGKTRPVRVHELLGRAATAPDEQRRLCAEFAAALEAYRARRWEEAVARWSAILRDFPGDGPSRFYLERARGHAAEPPPADWEATVRMTTK